MAVLATGSPAWGADEPVARRPRQLASEDGVACRDVATFCGALDRAAAVVADTVRERGLGRPETLERIAQLAALAKIGEGYEREGAFVACGDAVARACGASVARAMDSLADALRHADEDAAASGSDGT